MKTRIIIPAFNEEQSIGKVINAIPKDLVTEIIVVNNNSTDNTQLVANEHNATTLLENKKGYGNACLLGIKYINSLSEKTDIVVFLDGDYSDFPEDLPLLLTPIQEGKADFVLGSRDLGKKEKGSMMPQQIFGNWLATKLMNFFYKTKYTDLGPFRAIKLEKLNQLKMQDKTYGWTIEMQIKAAKLNFSVLEVPVRYRVRIGTSKVSGTVKGTILAGYKIITSIFKYL